MRKLFMLLALVPVLTAFSVEAIPDKYNQEFLELVRTRGNFIDSERTDGALTFRKSYSFKKDRRVVKTRTADGLRKLIKSFRRNRKSQIGICFTWRSSLIQKHLLWPIA